MAYAKRALKALAVAVIFYPSIAFGAGIAFTEVMYDVPGTDTGREWVEIQNKGSQTVDLADWKLFESSALHVVTLFQGASIPPGGFAVIADNPAKFLADWPSYSGVLFDTSFSLSNAGEPLVLRDDAGVDAASAAYDPYLGAGGDGNSFQWTGSAWVAAAPTPGSAYAGGASQPPAGSGNQTGSQATAATSSVSVPPPEKSIFADAGPDRTVFVGADSTFFAKAIGLRGEPLDNARYVWTFGDGGRLEGQSVAYHYSYPGTYTVILDVSSAKYAVMDRVAVTAIPAQVSLPLVNGEFVEIRNGSSAELDLGGWVLSAGGKSFAFPGHTILSPGETVIVPGAHTGISPISPEALSLLYPNGMFAASYKAPLVAARLPEGDAKTSAPSTAMTHAAIVSGSDASLHVGSSTETIPTSAAQAAAAMLADPEAEHGNSLFLWIGGLALLVAAGAAALFFSPRVGPAKEDAGKGSGYVVTEE